MLPSSTTISSPPRKRQKRDVDHVPIICANNPPVVVPLGVNDTSAVVPLGVNDISAVVPLGVNDTSAVVPLGVNDISAVVPLGVNDTSVVPLGVNDTSAVVPLGVNDTSVVPLGVNDTSVVPLGVNDTSVVSLGVYKIDLSNYKNCRSTRELLFKGIGRVEPITNKEERSQLIAIAESRLSVSIDQTTPAVVTGFIYTRDRATNFLPAAAILIVPSNTFLLVSISGTVRVSTDESGETVPEDPFVATFLVKVWGDYAYSDHANEYWALYQHNKFFRYLGANDDKQRYEICLMSEAIGLFEDRPLWIMKGGEAVRNNPVKVWIRDPSRRKLSSLIFDPSILPGFSDTVFNLFEGYGVKSREPTNALDHILLRFFKEIICGGNDEHFTFLMQLFAHKLQVPTEKLRVCIIFRGPMGVGKSTAIQILHKIWGRAFMEVSNMKHVTGQFNGHMEALSWLAVNEGFFAGSHEAAAAIKSLITESTLTVEKKFHDARTIESCMDILMTSNESWVFPGSRNNRRAFILDIPGPPRRDILDPLHAALDDKDASVVGEFMWYLQHQVQIPVNFDPNAIIQQMEPTKGAIDQLMQGYDGLIIQWFADHLADEEWKIRGIPFFQKDKETKVRSGQLVDAFKREIQDEGKLSRHGKNDDIKVNFTGALTVNQLTRNFNAMFGGDCIRNVRGEYIIPKREVLREEFKRHTLNSKNYQFTTTTGAATDMDVEEEEKVINGPTQSQTQQSKLAEKEDPIQEGTSPS